ncbi:MAG: hypothetical protein WCV86_00885 [Patescibacteria group bacterium]|jgi:hypothetical protein
MTLFLNKQVHEKLMKKMGYRAYRIVGWFVVWLITLAIPIIIAFDGLGYSNGGPTAREVVAVIFLTVLYTVMAWAAAYFCYYLLLRLGIRLFLGGMKNVQ